jgi:hypothetical protein
MTATMSHQAPPRFAQRKHNAATRAALVAGFWSTAAVLVAIVHQRMDAISPVASVVLKVGAILIIAAAYSRLAASEATLDHALFVGTTWVLLGIAAEIAVTTSSGRQWFGLIGSPANGGLRCVLLISWIIAPALFVRSHK